MKEYGIAIIIVSVLLVFLIHSYVIVHDGAVREQQTLERLDKITKWIDGNEFTQVCP